MHEQIQTILNSLQPSLAADGGAMELVAIDEDGTIRLRQDEDCGTSNTLVWTHRLRVERAIRARYPEADVTIAMPAAKKL